MVIAFVINDNLTHLIHRQCTSSTPHEHVVDEYCKIKLSINCNDFVQLQQPASHCFHNGALSEVLRKFSSSLSQV